MSNKRDLKAFVRFDGSGRIVAGSLILRKNKPKVGKWHEIQAYECCNYIPTTSTTTTQGGGATSYLNPYWANPYDSCVTTTAGNLLFYSASTSLQAGDAVFVDAELTIPVSINIVISISPFTKFKVTYGGILESYNCNAENTYIVDLSSSNACAGSGTSVLIYGNVANDPIIYANFIGSGFNNGDFIYVRYNDGGSWYTRRFNIQPQGYQAFQTGEAGIICPL